MRLSYAKLPRNKSPECNKQRIVQLESSIYNMAV